MSKESVFFEKQISRIHKLLEEDNVLVTWNDKIFDPDNPSQKRQIDITIKKENKITFIECRLHKSKQNVKWIEELIGRRPSLNADSIIGVSSSGFTEGAINKANKFGIFLRDLSDLTSDEVKSWGCTSKIKADFYLYKNLSVYYVFDMPQEDTILEQFKTNFHDFSNSILDEIKDHLNNDYTTAFTLLLIPPNWQLNNQKIRFVVAKGEAQRIIKELPIPVIKTYGIPKTPNIDRTIKIETTEGKEVEIIKTEEGNVMITLNVSSLIPDENMQFSGVFSGDLGKSMGPVIIDKIEGDSIKSSIHVQEKICTSKTENFLFEIPVLENFGYKSETIDLTSEDEIFYRIIADDLPRYNISLISKEIEGINKKINNNKDDMGLLVCLSILYIYNHDFSKAIKILQRLSQQNNLLQAKVLLNVIAHFDIDIMMNLHLFNFGYFIYWEQEPIDSNDIVAIVLIDGKEFELSEYIQSGMILPVLNLRGIGIRFIFKGSKKNKTKLFYDTIFLKFGLVNTNHEVCPKYSEIIAKLNIDLKNGGNTVVNLEDKYVMYYKNNTL